MPDCMKTDGVGPAKTVFDVDPEIVAKTYERMGPSENFFSKSGTA